ncbi:MAG: hypothetical protein ACRD59_08710 [Candidatus Acidiferrales bacterium]
MKMFKLMTAVAVVLLASTVVRADGLGDGRVGVSGGSGASGDCNSFQLTTDGTGAITTGPNTECKVTGANATSITVAVPVGQTGTGPGLQVYSPLLMNVTSQVPAWAQSWLAQFNWTESCPATPVTAGGVSAFECILTAPTMPTDPVSQGILNLLTQLGVINDGDCDNDDFVFYIPIGCDIKFTTDALAGLPGDTPDQLFSQNAQLGSTTNGSTDFVPFPEPGVLSLLLVGLAGLPIVRRRMAR